MPSRVGGWTIPQVIIEAVVATVVPAIVAAILLNESCPFFLVYCGWFIAAIPDRAMNANVKVNR